VSGDGLVGVSDVVVEYAVRGGGFRRSILRALDGVSLTVCAGEAVGVVGESGCGKSTLARVMLGLVSPVRGRVEWFGYAVDDLSPRKLRGLRARMQVVFQDPLASLNPLMSVGEIVGEPLRVHRRELDARARRIAVAGMLERVGLSPDMARRYPHEFSGGQCQRIGIARAMIAGPEFVVCDEAVSALDVSVQAQIVNLLAQFKRELDLSILFVSHNLAVVRHLCDRVLVLYLGQMMEACAAGDLLEAAVHPYTRSLITALPVTDPRVQPGRLAEVAAGDMPSPLAMPGGCPFHTRCTLANARCSRERPRWREHAPGHWVACHHV
jgi:oligopeptide transport system ATP-binding protein